jgi:NADPH2:quinone reductase
VRAVVCNELGPPSLLRVEERPDPEARPGQVVVDVEAAGVNYVDALFVAGQYQIKPPVPFVPGTESAGTVSSVGSGVDGVAVGQRVLVSAGLGGFASKVAADASAVTVVPDALDSARAATFNQSYSTCLYALRDRAAAQVGESVLVLGAGGGIGLAAIGVARALGCRVLGVASSEEKRAAAVAAGAEAAVDPAEEPVKDAARSWAGGTGVDIVIDPVGGSLAEPSLRALGDRGRYCVIGFAAGDIPSIPLNQVLLRNRTVIGIDWGIWAMQHGDAQRALLGDLLGMVAGGRIDPVRPNEYPLEDVARALEDLLGRRVVGKVALIP